MSVITFYTHVADIDLFTCRLAKRASDSGQTVFIWLDDPQRLDTLDRQLWTHDAESFLPHQIWSGHLPFEDDVPIWLAAGDVLPQLPNNTVVINLSDDFWHQAPSVPQRVLEIVGNHAEQLAAARTRFAAYKQNGFTLEHHNMQDKA